MKYLLIIILTVCIIPGDQLSAQQKEKDFELLEVVKIAETYKNASTLGFSINYTYADSAQPTTILETLSGETRISKGKYWTFLDSVEMIQGNNYRLAVYHRDSTIIVMDKVEYDDMFRMPFLDSAFSKSNIDSMSVNQLSDTIWQLAVLFNAYSGYSKYTLDYYPDNYRTKKIQYFIKHIPVDTAGVMSGTAVITLNINNYTPGAAIDEQFNESRFIYNQAGILTLRPEYDHFTLINNASN